MISLTILNQLLNRNVSLLEKERMVTDVHTRRLISINTLLNAIHVLHNNHYNIFVAYNDINDN